MFLRVHDSPKQVEFLHTGLSGPSRRWAVCVRRGGVG